MNILGIFIREVVHNPPGRNEKSPPPRASLEKKIPKYLLCLPEPPIFFGNEKGSQTRSNKKIFNKDILNGVRAYVSSAE